MPIEEPTIFRYIHWTGGNPCGNLTLEEEGITWDIQTYMRKEGFD